MNWLQEHNILEVRYSKGFRLWDSSGRLVMHILESYPEFEVSSAAPDKIELVRKRDEARITIGLSATIVRVNSEATPKVQVTELTDFVFRTVKEVLHIDVLTRAGNRIYYNTSSKSDADSKSIIDRLARTNKFGGSFLEIEDERLAKKQITDFHFRLADDQIGIFFQVVPSTTQISIDGPAPDELMRKLPPPSFAIRVDCDIYTVAPMRADDFLPVEFMKSNWKMIESRFLSLLK